MTGKFFAGAVLAGLSLCAYAAEVPVKAADFTPHAAMKQGFSVNGENVTLTGRVQLYSQAFPCQKGKRYGVKGTFQALPDTPDNYVYVGFIPLDARKKLIDHEHYVTVPQTLTKLAADVKPADKTIQIADGSKWVKGSVKAAFKAAADNSDLPNRNTSRAEVTGVEKKGDVWVVSFNRPVGVTAKAGELVRAHREGGYLYIAQGSTAKGIKDPAARSVLSVPGIKFFQITVLGNWKLVKGVQPKLSVQGVRMIEE